MRILSSYYLRLGLHIEHFCNTTLSFFLFVFQAVVSDEHKAGHIHYLKGGPEKVKLSSN